MPNTEGMGLCLTDLKTNNNTNVNSNIVVLCSGAEQAQEIYSHIREQTQIHLDGYAREGLRTLCIAKKVMLREGETK